jgi:hypothetical protein
VPSTVPSVTPFADVPICSRHGGRTFVRILPLDGVSAVMA